MHTYSQEFVTRAHGNVLAGTRPLGQRIPVRMICLSTYWTLNPDLR